MNEPRKDVRPSGWILVTGAGLVVFSSMAILFGVFADRMSGLSAPTFFFLLVALGLVAAGFLFGALRSYGKYSGKAYGGTLELGGPVVVLVLVVLLGYRFRPAEGSVSVTVNLFGAGGASALIDHGEVKAYYGNGHASKTITDGQIVLSEIPRELRGKEIRLLPLIEGYSGKEQKAIIPTDGSPINLYLDKLSDSVTFGGIVLGPKGTVVRNATLVVADGLGRTQTDEFGNFRLTLPLKDGAETRLRVYVGDALKYNSLVRISNQVPLSIPIE